MPEPGTSLDEGPAAGGAVDTSVDTKRWGAVLDDLEDRIERWRSAIGGAGAYPGEFAWPEGLGPCPAHLLDRARRLNAAQQDLHARLTLRRDALSSLLRSDSRQRSALPVPLFVDQRS